MKILWNGTPLETQATALWQLQQPGQECVIIYNGYQTEENHSLQDGDTVVVIDKGAMPDRTQLEAMLMARHTPQVHEKIKDSAVAIAGVGGLGSNIAMMLARLGVGRLLLVDCDTVEPSNLNRQHYTLRHLGMPKVEAMAMQIAEVNPFVQVETRQQRIAADNVATLFAGWPVICEALDRPETKALLTQTLLMETDATVVASSGMAGYGPANEIHTRKAMGRLYLCGDEATESMPGQGLMAPRVQVCAGHQANQVLRLLLGLTD